MKAIIYSFSLLFPLMTLGCEKTIHEVSTPLPHPDAVVAAR